MTVVVFGAFDRHNLGDLVFPHVLGALRAPLPLVFTGLRDSDLSRHGGHRVRDIAAVTQELADTPVHFIHAGGELLSCSADDAARMLAPARPRLPPFPYVRGKRGFRHPGLWIHHAVGGVALDPADGSARAELLPRLKEADVVTVRDRATLATLAGWGLPAQLLPDAAILVPTLFRDRIACHRRNPWLMRLCRRFPQGYVAVQASGDFADDASLDALAAALDGLVAETGLGVVFFCMGAAPMHDHRTLYRRLAARMRQAGPSAILPSLDLWTVCAFLESARAVVASSLHARILAMAWGLPRVTLAADARGARKPAAFVATWEHPRLPGVVHPQEALPAVLAALAADRGLLAEHTAHLRAHYHAVWDGISLRTRLCAP